MKLEPKDWVFLVGVIVACLTIVRTALWYMAAHS
jgi:hypothetical protein